MSTSKVWKFFKNLQTSSEVQCLICSKKLKYNDSSTRSMWNHIKLIHPEFSELSEDKFEDKSQKLIGNFFDKTLATASEQEKVEDFFLELMVDHNLPFRFFDDTKVLHLFQKAYPNLKAMGRDHYRRNVLPRQAAKVRSTIKEKVDVDSIENSQDEFDFTHSEIAFDSLENDILEESNDVNFDIWENFKPKSPATTSQFSSGSTNEFKAHIKAELALFQSLDRIGRKDDIFNWWKENKARFSELAWIGRILFSIPATSVSSERLFSKAGLIYSNSLRNRLHTKTVDDILAVKANLHNLNLGESYESDSDIEDTEKNDEFEI